MRALAGAVLLAACGQTTSVETPAQAPVANDPPPSVAADAAAGPSGQDNMTWHFTERTGQRPSLRYSSYGSEGHGITLQCEGANAYAILWRGAQRDSWPFTLQSGAARAELIGAGEGQSEVVVTGTLPLDSPVLAAFRESGALSVSEDGRTTVMDAINDQERATIAQFFTACS